MLKWFCESGRHGAQFPRSVTRFQGTHRAKSPRLALPGSRPTTPPPISRFHLAGNHHSDERVLRYTVEPGKPADCKSRLRILSYLRPSVPICEPKNLRPPLAHPVTHLLSWSSRRRIAPWIWVEIKKPPLCKIFVKKTCGAGQGLLM